MQNADSTTIPSNPWGMWQEWHTTNLYQTRYIIVCAADTVHSSAACISHAILWKGGWRHINDNNNITCHLAYNLVTCSSASSIHCLSSCHSLPSVHAFLCICAEGLSFLSEVLGKVPTRYVLYITDPCVRDPAAIPCKMVCTWLVDINTRQPPIHARTWAFSCPGQLTHVPWPYAKSWDLKSHNVMQWINCTPVSCRTWYYAIMTLTVVTSVKTTCPLIHTTYIEWKNNNEKKMVDEICADTPIIAADLHLFEDYHS